MKAPRESIKLYFFTKFCFYCMSIVAVITAIPLNHGRLSKNVHLKKVYI